MIRSLDETVTTLLARQAPPSQDELASLYESVTPTLLVWARIQLSNGLERRIEAEELVQETWMRALGALESFDPSKGQFRAWLIGIARNVLLEAFRSLSREPAFQGATGDSLALSRCPDSVTSITRRIASSDALQRFVEHVAALDQAERVLITCCGLEGVGPQEAARRLGISAAAAAKRWQRLRSQLAEREAVLALFGD